MLAELIWFELIRQDSVIILPYHMMYARSGELGFLTLRLKTFSI